MADSTAMCCMYCQSREHGSGDHRAGIDKRQTVALAFPGSVPGQFPTAKELGRGWQALAPVTNTALADSDPLFSPVQKTCQGCGVLIDEGARRLKVSATVLDRDGALKSDLFYFCAKCSTSLPILTLPNVLCTAAQTEEVVRRAEEMLARESEDAKARAIEALRDGAVFEDLGWDETIAVEEDEELRTRVMNEAEAGRQSGELKSAEAQQSLRAGDLRPFNKIMPTSASKRDSLGHAVAASRIDRQASESDGARPSFEAVVSNSKRPAARGASDGEAGQRETIKKYLNDPRSRGTLRENQRRALRLWADGAPQSEVGMDQGNFSNLKKTTLAKAYSGR